jgi:hypothetical protein
MIAIMGTARRRTFAEKGRITQKREIANENLDLEVAPCTSSAPPPRASMCSCAFIIIELLGQLGRKTTTVEYDYLESPVLVSEKKKHSPIRDVNKPRPISSFPILS